MISTENKLLESLAKHLDAGTMIAAVEAQAATSLDRQAQFKLLFEVYLDAQWGQGMKPVTSFVKHYYGQGRGVLTPEQELCAADLISAVCDVVRDRPIGQGALFDPEWVEALKYVISRDAVGTLKKLDEVGLIERSDLGPDGPLREVWVSSIVETAERCAQYLLSTTPFSDLGGFPVLDRGVWPATMQMARNIASNVPENEYTQYLADVFAAGSYSTKDWLRSAALSTICAALERASESEVLRSSSVFQELLEATVVHTALKDGPEIKDSEMARALLRLMERCDRVNSPEAFAYVRYLLACDTGGDVLAPAYLESLLDRGLPVEGTTFFRSKHEPHHLLTEASACHIDIVDRYVVDKVAYMRDFGSAFARAHAKRSPNNNSTDIEKAFQGVENAALLKIVELGYPLGPINIDGEHFKGLYPLYQRVGDGAGLDAFIVGHVSGQLDSTHSFKGIGPMHLAVAMGHIPTVRALAAAGYSLDEPCGKPYDTYNETRCYDRAGFPPILMAIKSGNVAMVRELIDLGADLGIKGPTGATLIQLAKNDAIKELIRAARTSTALIKGLEQGSAGVKQSARPSREPSAL